MVSISGKLCNKRRILIIQINGSGMDHLTIHEARRLVEKSKDKLQLVVSKNKKDKRFNNWRDDIGKKEN